MIEKLRKVVVYSTLTLGLVAGLFGGAMHWKAAAPLQHHVNTHSSQQQTALPRIPCPPPPFDCG